MGSRTTTALATPACSNPHAGGAGLVDAARRSARTGKRIVPLVGMALLLASAGCGAGSGTGPAVTIGPMPALATGSVRVLRDALDFELAAIAPQLGLSPDCAADVGVETSDAGRVGLGRGADGSELVAVVDLELRCPDGRTWSSREHWSWLAPLDPAAGEAARQHAADEALRHAVALAVRRLAPGAAAGAD